MSPEELASLGTSIAIAITCDKSLAELCEIKNLINQIHCSVQSIYNQSVLIKKT